MQPSGSKMYHSRWDYFGTVVTRIHSWNPWDFKRCGKWEWVYCSVAILTLIGQAIVHMESLRDVLRKINGHHASVDRWLAGRWMVNMKHEFPQMNLNRDRRSMLLHNLCSNKSPSMFQFCDFLMHPFLVCSMHLKRWSEIRSNINCAIACCSGLHSNGQQSTKCSSLRSLSTVISTATMAHRLVHHLGRPGRI